MGALEVVWAGSVLVVLAPLAPLAVIVHHSVECLHIGSRVRLFGLFLFIGKGVPLWGVPPEARTKRELGAAVRSCTNPHPIAPLKGCQVGRAARPPKPARNSGPERQALTAKMIAFRPVSLMHLSGKNECQS